jgi:hypothetical protein
MTSERGEWREIDAAPTPNELGKRQKEDEEEDCKLCHV